MLYNVKNSKNIQIYNLFPYLHHPNPSKLPIAPISNINS